MPTCLALMRWTKEGLEKVKERPSRFLVVNRQKERITAKTRRSGSRGLRRIDRLSPPRSPGNNPESPCSRRRYVGSKLPKSRLLWKFRMDALFLD
jgi:hypothetical protein